MNDARATMDGKRVLVVEDEYFIAKSLVQDLSEIGAEVIGPVASVEEALQLIRLEPLDAAVLDVNLRGELAFSVADALSQRSVPYVFATGYAGDALPGRFEDVRRCEKPVQAGALAAALCGAMT